MIKWKKQPSLKTEGPTLPSYQHMYKGDLSGESNTCVGLPVTNLTLLDVLANTAITLLSASEELENLDSSVSDAIA